MNELLPCPFCGGEAKVAIGQGQNDGHGYIVFCDRCWVSQPYLDKTEAEAIAAWNTRAERTCHYKEHDALVMLSCDVCGHGSLYRPNYCPNCGARVVSE